MLLKAAYFQLIGLAESDPITFPIHIQSAIHNGRTTHRIAWPNRGAGHNIMAWAELLVAERTARPGMSYPAEFEREVQQRGQTIAGPRLDPDPIIAGKAARPPGRTRTIAKSVSGVNVLTLCEFLLRDGLHVNHPHR